MNKYTLLLSFIGIKISLNIYKTQTYWIFKAGNYNIELEICDSQKMFHRTSCFTDQGYVAYNKFHG